MIIKSFWKCHNFHASTVSMTSNKIPFTIFIMINFASHSIKLFFCEKPQYSWENKLNQTCRTFINKYLISHMLTKWNLLYHHEWVRWRMEKNVIKFATLVLPHRSKLFLFRQHEIIKATVALFLKLSSPLATRNE